MILDMIMPGMGGKQCLKRIMKLIPAARVLIASGFSGDRAAQEAMDLGASGVISKPFSVNQLLRAVRASLDGSPAPSGAESRD